MRILATVLLAGFLTALVIVFGCGPFALAAGDHYVHAYTTKNGSYVAQHYQTNPNRTKLDNYSTRGNVNPYTGQPGTRSPY